MKRVLLFLCVASPLTGQSARAQLEGRVPAPSVPALDSLIRVATSESLPTGSLIQKAIEGGAKRVPGDRIVGAVEVNIEQLRQAKALLIRAGDAPPATGAEVTTVVSALKRGLSVPIVERVVAALPNQPRSPAFHAVADMVAHGFDPDAATDLILAAAREQMRGPRLLDVSGAAIQEVQRGRTRAHALVSVRGQLPNVPAAPSPGRSTVQGARRPTAPAHKP